MFKNARIANSTVVVVPSPSKSWAIVEKHVGHVNVFALPVQIQK